MCRSFVVTSAHLSSAIAIAGSLDDGGVDSTVGKKKIKKSMNDMIAAMPKAELHVHLEGTLEVEMMFAFAGVDASGPTLHS